MKLTSTKVEEIFVDCLYKKNQPKDNMVIVEGVAHKFGFNPRQLSLHKQEIIDLLAELPDTFYEGSGGGWSFLQACEDKHGNHWGEHFSMEKLFCLGVGINRVKELFPKELRTFMPGGVPYYVIFNEDKEVSNNGNEKI